MKNVGPRRFISEVVGLLSVLSGTLILFYFLFTRLIGIGTEGTLLFLIPVAIWQYTAATAGLLARFEGRYSNKEQLPSNTEKHETNSLKLIGQTFIILMIGTVSQIMAIIYWFERSNVLIATCFAVVGLVAPVLTVKQFKRIGKEMFDYTR